MSSPLNVPFTESGSGTSRCELTDGPEIAFDGGLADRRREACAAARRDLADASRVADPDSIMPTMTAHPFGEGRIVVALGGSFDAAGVERLHELIRHLRPVLTEEFVLELSGLTQCDRRLARVIARWRISLLIVGVIVELHGAPDAVRAELAW